MTSPRLLVLFVALSLSPLVGCNGGPERTGEDPCLESPCENGGTCAATEDGFSCTCPAGFGGSACETNVDECAPAPCENGGTCTDGVNGFTCACPSGYVGPTCASDVDDCASDPCQNGGTCVDGANTHSCSCAAGYTGASCEIDVDDCASDPCENGGTCTDRVNGFDCECPSDHPGPTCSGELDDCSSVPCQNGGTCVDGDGGATCECAPGYSGARCEHDVDDCAANPCMHGGVCADVPNAFVCACASGYAGNVCESCAAGYQDEDGNGTCTPTCPNSGLGTCSGHGSCASTTGTALCTCTGGYVGATCDACANGKQDHDGDGTCTATCASSGLGNCSGHGACSDATGTAACACTDGHGGATCDACAPGMQDHDGDGTCTTTCAGSSLGTCSGHGTCADASGTARCICMGGYAGTTCDACGVGKQDRDGDGFCMPTCATSGIDGCSGHGTCSDASGTATCACNGGYTGAGCDVCASGTQDHDGDGTCTASCAAFAGCSGHGTCSDTSGTAACACSGGYVGLLCNVCAPGTQDYDGDGACTPTCATSPIGSCGGHGTCSDASGTAICACTGDHAGAGCETCSPSTQDHDGNGTCTPTCATSGITGCSGHGACSDASGTAACACTDGYGGASCDACAPGMQDHDGDGSCLPTCAASPIGACSGHGTCSDASGHASCTCTGGYGGAQCEGCPGGTQDNDGNGTCTPTCGASGIGACSGFGTCSDASGTATCTCSGNRAQPACLTCNPGLQDLDLDGLCTATCATSGLGNCSGHGSCSHNTGTAQCSCGTGYTGPLCAACRSGWQDNDNDGDCSPTCATSSINGCSGYGTCSDASGTATCTCDAEHIGFNCSTPLSACAPSPCRNGGTCSLTPTGYTCSCPPDAAGVNCEIKPDCLVPTDAELVWSHLIPTTPADYDSPEQVPYAVDRRAALEGTLYERVGYCLQIAGAWTYVEMDDFTGGDLDKTRLPVDDVFDQPVTNLNVRASSPAVETEVSSANGKIEFWSNCYSPGPDGVFDYDDDMDPTPHCFGSMQVHAPPQTVLSYNGWSSGTEPPWIGWGGQNVDWTHGIPVNDPAKRAQIHAFIRRGLPVRPGLAAHYDARDQRTLVFSTESQRELWRDLSGNVRDLWGSDARPMYTAPINGQPALRFDDVDQRLSSAPFPLSANVSVFAVVHWGSAEPWGAIAHHGDRDADWSLEQNGIAGANGRTHFQSENDNTGVEQTLVTGESYVLAARLGTTREYTVVSASARSSVYGGGSSITPGNKPLYVGSSSAFEDSRAWIGELLYYDRSLTSPERDLVIAYLQQGWGIGSTFQLTFPENDTSSDGLETSAIQQFLRLTSNQNLGPSDFAFFDLPGGAVEFGGYCFNNADWLIDRYLAAWNAPSEQTFCAGDGLDPDGAGPLTTLDSTLGYQAFWHGPGSAPYAWNGVPLTSSACSGAGSPFRMGGSGASAGSLSPNDCQGGGNASPFDDLCLGVRPGETTASELRAGGPAPNGSTLTFRVGTNGASRAQVCGF